MVYSLVNEKEKSERKKKINFKWSFKVSLLGNDKRRFRMSATEIT